MTHRYAVGHVLPPAGGWGRLLVRSVRAALDPFSSFRPLRSKRPRPDRDAEVLGAALPPPPRTLLREDELDRRSRCAGASSGLMSLEHRRFHAGRDRAPRGADRRGV